ncbi:30S ribosomal protein S17e [Candidatus Woesearchaeota archaeon]|nr:30S ribosomal protein S17e [Candidatus Woesearchaeota archaeon]
MGRIRTTFVKTNGIKIYRKYRDKFTNDFNNNKKSLDEVAELNSKKLRNVIAGYITQTVKKESKK